MTLYVKRRLTLKGLFLLVALALVSLAGPVTRPALAYCGFYLECPVDPPMHWDSLACACVCEATIEGGDPYNWSHCTYH